MSRIEQLMDQDELIKQEQMREKYEQFYGTRYSYYSSGKD